MPPQCLDGSLQHLELGALDIDLDEARREIEMIERLDRDIVALTPEQAASKPAMRRSSAIHGLALVQEA
jgi:hypothetical protein